MAKSILFDLDGTLTDSGEGIINCVLLTLDYFGIPQPPREDLRFVVGPPLAGSFIKLGIPANRTNEAIEYYRVHYTATGIHQNTVYPGIPELLKKLRDQGHKLYVATSKPEYMAKQILEGFGLAHNFEIIRGASPDSSGGLDNTVMVGDTIYDVEGASCLGIPAVGVSWGYGNVEEMVSGGAAAIAYNTDELFELLNR